MSDWERIEPGFYRYRHSAEPADVVKNRPGEWEANYRPQGGSRTKKTFSTAREAKLFIELTLRR